MKGPGDPRGLLDLGSDLSDLGEVEPAVLATGDISS